VLILFYVKTPHSPLDIFFHTFLKDICEAFVVLSNLNGFKKME